MARPPLFAVAGRPILHSRSPEIFAAAYAGRPQAGRYTRLSVGSAEEALEAARQLGLAGLNVSAPFKERALALADETDEDARRVGAANLLLRIDGGRVRAANTDRAGAAALLRLSETGPEGARCVVLGAGGAARAAVVALQDGGAAGIVVVRRSPERGRRLARQLGCQHCGWEEAAPALGRADLVVGCLPPAAGVVDPRWLAPGQVVVEAAYTPSRLAMAARAAGCSYRDGRAWLLAQAARGFEAMTGEAPDEAAMARSLERPPAPRGSGVVLCGISGAGKTTVGELLARKLGRAFVDTDARVAERAGSSVDELFALRGEGAFRKLERVVVAELAPGDAVVALGGGALLHRGNRPLARRAGSVVWLWVPVAVAAARLRRGSRPLLDAAAPDRARRDHPPPLDASLRELLARRWSGYVETADVILAAQGTSPDELAHLLAEEIAAAGTFLSRGTRR